MLIGKSKVRAYVRDKAGLKVSKEYYVLLNKELEKMIDSHIANTKGAKKKTLGHYSIPGAKKEEPSCREGCPVHSAESNADLIPEPALPNTSTAIAGGPQPEPAPKPQDASSNTVEPKEIPNAIDPDNSTIKGEESV